MGNIISGAVEGITGKGAQKEAEKNSKSARKLTDIQAQMAKANMPTLDQLRKLFGPLADQISGLAGKAVTDANQYDPAVESERALLAFDTAAKGSLDSELGAVNSSFTNRGFSSGNASSDQGGANQDVLARRAFNRGAFAANMKMGESDKKRAVDANAFNTVSNAFGMTDPTGRTTSNVGALSAPITSYGNLASLAQNQANQADPSGAIGAISGALKGVKWPWEKKKSQDTVWPELTQY